jgi:hypothetical protein
LTVVSGVPDDYAGKYYDKTDDLKHASTWRDCEEFGAGITTVP